MNEKRALMPHLIKTIIQRIYINMGGLDNNSMESLDKYWWIDNYSIENMENTDGIDNNSIEIYGWYL